MLVVTPVRRFVVHLVSVHEFSGDLSSTVVRRAFGFFNVTP